MKRSHSVPEYLLSHERLDALMALLLEKEQALSSLGAKDFGPRVTDGEMAKRLLSRVSGCTRKVLGLSGLEVVEPELTLRHNLSRLPAQTIKSYLFFVLLCSVLALAAASQEFRTPYIPSIIIVALGQLLLIPLLVHRRTMLHLEHQCQYVRTGEGKGTIVVEELHSVPFQSYLAHEYGHHLLSSLSIEPEEPWVKEGWTRLVQWRVVNQLAEEEGNPAFLHHALFQIVSELKFVCTLIAGFHNRRLPRKILRIRTLYHFNPLYNLITGTPGVHTGKLLEHALGTAVFFLECREKGIDKVLSTILLSLTEDLKGALLRHGHCGLMFDVGRSSFYS